MRAAHCDTISGQVTTKTSQNFMENNPPQAGDDFEYQLTIRTIDELTNPAATDACLRELGLTRSFGQHRDGVSVDFAGVRLAALAQKKLGIAGIGFEIATRADITVDLNTYGYAMLAARTVGKMLEIGIRFNRRHANDTGYQVLQNENGVAVQFYVRGLTGNLQSLQMEMIITAMWRYLRQLRPEMGLGELHKVNLSYGAPGHHARYRDYFGVPIDFGQANTELILDPEIMSRRISSKSQIAGEILSEQTDRTLDQLERKTGIVDSVRRQLLRSVHGEWTELDEIAAGLGTSGRTLKRRLNERGTSFKQISNEVRMTLAREYVATTVMSNNEISELLGYAQTPAFYRAYKNWFGESPGATRSRDFG